MKNRFLFIFLLSSFFSFAQISIKGKVLSNKNEPIEGATVYLNNTTYGTITNVKGEFSFEAKNGQFQLIISFLGYKKTTFLFNTTTYKKPLIFKLSEETNLLDEVVIKKTKYDANWKYNLSVFKEEFIGKTELAKDCKILNEKALHFEFNSKENKLTAFAKEPLKIKHTRLGYLITYELEHFVKHKNYVTYLGYSRYKSLKGSKRKQRKWNKNRLKAYNGSPVHFFKSVMNNTFTEEGFIVNQFKRVSNPKRPSKEEIQKARQILRLYNKPINFSTKITKPKNAIDSALITLEKVRLPKFIDYLYKSKLTQNDIISKKNNSFFLSFDNNLSIVYNKEEEEEGYTLRNIFSKKREALPLQTSSLIQQKKNSIIDKSGVLVNPLNIFYERYWSYEKFANTLPLDYNPKD